MNTAEMFGSKPSKNGKEGNIKKWACKHYYRGESQIVHLSTALAGLDNMQVEHVQELSPALGGALTPAAPQLNACTGALGGGALDWTGTADPGLDGRDASQTVHFSVALAGFDNMHVEQVQAAPAGATVGVFIPAAPQSNAFATGDGFALRLKDGREDLGIDLARSRALAICSARDMPDEATKAKTKVGRESRVIERATSFGSKGIAGVTSFGARSSLTSIESWGTESLGTVTGSGDAGAGAGSETWADRGGAEGANEGMDGGAGDELPASGW